jgi:glycosyltransferase involved in cell wall biosynthesis
MPETNKTIKVGWCISGDMTVASSRLQGFHVHKEFLQRGINSEIVASDFNSQHTNYSGKLLGLARRLLRNGYDVLLFERPNWMMYKLSLWCRLNGIRTIAIRCDDIPGEYDRYFDATIVPTEKLKALLSVRRAFVIEDMIEVPPKVFKNNYAASGKRLKVVWVGHGSYRDFISQFLDRLSSLLSISDKVEFVTISKGDWPTHKWSLDTVFSYILDCDIAIVPMPKGPQYVAKSANRLNMFMALGMPTIASPLPAYESFARHGENCLLATSIEEFALGIDTLQDQVTREKLGYHARDCAWRHFSPENITTQWLKVVERVISSPLQSPIAAGLQDRILAWFFNI